MSIEKRINKSQIKLEEDKSVDANNFAQKVEASL